MNPKYVWSLFSRTDWEANEDAIIMAGVMLIQKRDWGDDDDRNNFLHQVNFTARKDNADYALFCYATCKMGEVLTDDWADYQTACGVGQHIKGEYGLGYISSTWGFTLTTNSWYAEPIPFVPDNKQENGKSKGFSVAYAIDQFSYSDKDTTSICENILKIEATAENKAVVDSEFNKTDYEYSLNTNVLIYVWDTPWDKQSSISRKECKTASKQGSRGAMAGVFRDKDIPKVQAHYRIKEKKEK